MIGDNGDGDCKIKNGKLKHRIIDFQVLGSFVIQLLSRGIHSPKPKIK